MRKRLYVMEGPDGKPIGFFPTDIVMAVPVNLPEEPTGLKDDKGNEVPPAKKYRKDITGLVSQVSQQPIFVKGEIPAVCNELNGRLKWAEGDDAKPGEVIEFPKPAPEPLSPELGDDDEG